MSNTSNTFCARTALSSVDRQQGARHETRRYIELGGERVKRLDR